MADRQGAKSAVVTAASRLFLERGYEGSTMEAIAAAAGVSKATLYRYVPSKEALRDLLAPDLPDADLERRDARDRILEATMELTARQGFARTSLEEIAAEAGVSRSAIYWHFKGKEDLLAAIVADYSPAPEIMAIIQEADDLPFREMVRRVYRAYLEGIAPRSEFFRAIFVEVQGSPELAALFQEQIGGPIFAALGRYLECNAAREGLPPISPVLLLQALLGPLVFHILTRGVMERQFGLDFPLDQVGETFLRIFLDGIRSPSGALPDARKE